MKIFIKNNKSKRKVMLFILIVTILITSVTAVVTANKEENNNALNMNLTTALGSSGEVDLAQIEQEGSIHAGDLKLVLGLSQQVEHVKMTLPDGAVDEKDAESAPENENKEEQGIASTPEAMGINLEDDSESAQDDLATMLDKDSVVLGSSDIEQPKNIQDDLSPVLDKDSVVLGSSDTEQEEKQVIFDAPITGIYTFNFYDSNNTYLGFQTFIVGTGLHPNALTLEMHSTSDPLNYRTEKPEGLTVTFDYTPMLTGEKEVLTVALPPYFTMTSTPGGGADYTIEKKKIALPTEFYSDSDSDILRTMPASQTNVDALVITFSEEAVNAVSLTATFRCNAAGRENLGRAMLAYGTDPDIIPLRLTAKAASLDGSKLVSAKSINTTSKIPDANGDNTNGDHESVPVVKIKPGQVTTSMWRFQYKHLQPTNMSNGGTHSTTGGNAISVGAWHYPIYDLEIYIPHIDGLTLDAFDGTTNIGGKDYQVVNYNARNNNLFYPQNSASMNKNYDYRLTGLQSALQTGDTYNIDPMYMSYKYRGVQYGPILVATSDPIVLPAYSENFGKDYNSVSHISNLKYRYDRLQETADKLYFHMSSAHESNINPTYDDFEYKITFPYEISPTGIYNMSTGHNGLEHRYLYPKEIEYNVYGDATPRYGTVTHTENNTRGTVAFTGLGADEHIKEVFIRYDSVLPATRFEYYFDTKNSRYHEDGNELPTTFPTTIYTEINANKVKQKDLPTAESTPYKQSDSKLYNLLRFDKEDSLIFGVRNDRRAETTNLYGAVEKPYFMLSGAQWTFRRTTNEMKDYNNVVFRLTPKTEEDKDLLSVTNGLYTRRDVLNTATSGYKVFYKTNLKTDWTFANQHTPAGGTYLLSEFDLVAGEYSTEIMATMDTVDGNTLNYGAITSYDKPTIDGDPTTGGIDSSASPFGEERNIGFWLSMDSNKRTFYTGDTLKEKPIDPTKTYTLTGSVTVDGSNAQHINEADKEDGKFFNNSADATYKFVMGAATNLTRDGHFTLSNFNSHPGNTAWAGGNPYQGNIFRFRLENYGGGFVKDISYTLNKRVYLEVYNYIELTSLTGYNIVDTKPITADTTLYIFEQTGDTGVNSYYLFGKIRADAPTNQLIPMFVEGGVSYTDFEKDYMSEINGVPYYERTPFYKYTVTQRLLKAAWNIDPTNLYQFTASAAASINVQIHTEDSINLQMYASGVLKGDVGDFKHHEREDLEISAEMGNVKDAEIPVYEAIFKLPIKNGQTETLPNDQGLVQYEDNEYDLFLREPVAIDPTLDSFAVTYYTDYDATAPITITAASPKSDFELVKSIKVYFEKFPPKSTKIVKIPVRTQHEKNAKEDNGNFDSPLAFVGASSRKDGSGTFSVHEAKPFKFDSYSFTMRVGVDINETGAIQSMQNGIAEVVVYYSDGTTSTELHSFDATTAAKTITVNHDVEKIIVKAKDPSLYNLTVQKYPGVVEANNSDYPADPSVTATYGVLQIDKQHLYSSTPGVYDAAFFRVPTVTAPAIVAKIAQSSTHKPTVHILNNINTRPNALRSYIKEIILDPASQDIADVSFTQDNNGIITMTVVGKKRGTIDYTYKVTSPLQANAVKPDMYVYSGKSTITVTPDYVPTATIKKAYDNNGIALNSADKFNFNFYEKDDSGNKVYAAKVVGVAADGTSSPIVDSTSGEKILAKGFTHYLNEESLVGYNILHFFVNIDGTQTTVSADLNDEFAFDIPANALSVAITAVNENTPTILDVKKVIAASSAIIDNNQTFNIIIKDHLNNVVFDQSLKNNETLKTTEMIFGRTYTVTETAMGNYELNAMSVKKNGTIAGAQPNIASSYSFVLSTAQDLATITVENKYQEGNGIKLTKLLDNAGAPAEDFEFELKRVDNAFTYTGKVAKATPTAPAATVTWYDSTNTPISSIDSLPIGVYEIRETSTNKSFEFSKVTFDTTNTNISVSGDGKVATVTVTKTSPLASIQVENKVKTTGSVTINKKYNPYDFTDKIIFELIHASSTIKYIGEAQYNGTNYDAVNGHIVVDKIYKDGDVSKTDINGALPLGKYELTELASTHYNFDGFTSSKPLTNDGVLGNKKVSFVLSGQDSSDENKITVTATNDLKKGKITVTKSLTPSLVSGTSKTFNFDLYRWNAGANAAVFVTTKPVVMTTSNLGGETVEFTGDFEYGKYFVIEKNDTAKEYSLIAGTSTVLAEGTALTVANATTFATDTPLDFKANNEINKSSKELVLYKQVLDAADASAQTTFNFVLKWNGTDIYSGSVISNAAGTSTAPGKKIAWSKVGTHTNGILTAGNLTKLYYGTYTIEETIPAGSEFMLKEITATTGLGTVSAVNKAFNFTINDTSEKLADYTVNYTNQFSKVKTANIAKDFEVGSTNIRKIDFNFTYREGTNTSTEKQINNVKDKNIVPTPVPISLELERGKTYQIKEEAILGYTSSGFKVKINDAAQQTLVQVGTTGWYELVVPINASKVEIVAFNESVPASMKVTKQVAGINLDELTADFKVTITEKPRPTVIIWEKTDLKSGQTANVDVLVDGIEYIVKEVHNQTTPAYVLSGLGINASAGGSVGDAGLQHDSASNTYSFKKTLSGENATILITNKMITGKGINLAKHIPNGTQTSLDKESFEFTITSPNGFAAYGRAENTVANPAVFPATVKWYFKADYTDAAITLEDLPIGTYTVTEKNTNVNFEFDKFTDSSDVKVGTTSFTFDVTAATTLRDFKTYNKVKSGGKVTINKEFPAFTIGDTFEFTLKNLDSNVSYIGKAAVAAGSSTATVSSWALATAPNTPLASLPVGRYELKETNSGIYYASDGFDVNSVSANPNANLSLNSAKDAATFTLSNTVGKTAEVTLKAHNKLGTGTIILKKEVSGTTTNLPQDFIFNLYKMNGTKAELANPGNTPIKISLTAAVTSGTLTINDMTYGTYYLVEESNQYYGLQANSGLTEEGEGATDLKKQDILPGNATITFNAYNRSRTAEKALFAYKNLSEILPNEQETFGLQLIIKPKTGAERILYSGVVSTDASGQLTQPKFKWTDVGAAGNGTLNSDSTEIEELEHGSYILRETASGNSYEFNKFTGTLGSAVGKDWTFEVNKLSERSDLIFDLHNKPKEVGKININKIIEGPNTFPDTMFTFQLENITSAKKYTATIKAGQTIAKWTTTNTSGVTTDVTNGKLPFGSYKLTEISTVNFSLKKFDNITPTAVGTATATQANLRLNNTNSSVSVDAINAVGTDGVVAIAKVFDNNGYNHDDSNEFTFLLYGPEVNGAMPTTGVPVKVNKNGWKTSVSNLVYGKYMVKEDLSATPEYALASLSNGKDTVNDNSGIIFVVGKDINQSQNTTITATNSVLSNGTITLKKEIEGENGSPDAEFTFVITDAKGNVQNVVLKANEEKTITGLLYGSITVEEALSENYNHTGGEISGGSRIADTKFTIPVLKANGSYRLTTFSKNKIDATFKITANVTKELESIKENELFKFTLEQSTDKGATWKPFVSTRAASVVELQIGESHTFANLLRGASYRIKAVIDPKEVYQVKGIELNGSTVGTVDTKAKTFEFIPLKENLNSDITYLLDIKRVNIEIFKYLTLIYSGGQIVPLDDAKFRLDRIDADKTVFYDKGITANAGVLIFEGVTAGEYKITETAAPAGAKILDRNFKIFILNNDTTGELDITIEGASHSNMHNGVLNIANELVHTYPKDDVKHPWKIDTDSPLEYLDLEGMDPELDPEIEPDDYTKPSIIPNAGGLPLSYVSLVGLAALTIGVIAKKRKKKDANDSHNA